MLWSPITASVRLAAAEVRLTRWWEEFQTLSDPYASPPNMEYTRA